MQRWKLVCATAAFMISAAAQGQGTPQAAGTQFASEAQGNYDRIKANILKAADKMPPESYSYKPTADIRSFGRVVNHVTEAQFHICGGANGVAEPPKAPAETADKAAIIEALKASFAECDKAYAGTTPANMTDLVSTGPTKWTRLSMLWGNIAHDNEQYATLSLYLRLKGIVPPSSEK